MQGNNESGVKSWAVRDASFLIDGHAPPLLGRQDRYAGPFAYLSKYAYFDSESAIELSSGLSGKLVQTKSAASEIKRALVGRHSGFELGCDGVKVLLAALFNLQKTGLPHDPQVFGDVVL